MVSHRFCGGTPWSWRYETGLLLALRLFVTVTPTAGQKQHSGATGTQHHAAADDTERVGAGVRQHVLATVGARRRWQAWLRCAAMSAATVVMAV